MMRNIWFKKKNDIFHKNISRSPQGYNIIFKCISTGETKNRLRKLYVHSYIIYRRVCFKLL